MNNVLSTALVIVAAVLAWLGVVWLWRLGNPLRIRRLPRHWKSVGGEERDPLVALAVAVNAPVCEQSRVDALFNGDNIFPAMLDAIERAQTSISFLTFIYWSGDIAERFAAALARAARRGVDVRVLLDGFGSMRMPEELAEMMREGGCRVAVFHPIRWRMMHRANYRTHRKVLVVDSREGFTGGVGIAEEWTGNAEDPSHWRDTHFHLSGSVVGCLHTAFDENWRVATGELVGWQPPRSAIEGDARIVPILGRPGVGLSKMALTVWHYCRRARERLWLQTPYLVPSDALVEALCAAAERGVDVRIMVPGEHQDRWLVALSSRNFYRAFLEAGVTLLEFPPTMLHCKTLVADRDSVLIGSANLDHRSFEINYEMQLAVQAKQLNEVLSRAFLADQERCRRIVLADVERWTWRERLAIGLATTLRRQL